MVLQELLLIIQNINITNGVKKLFQGLTRLVRLLEKKVLDDTEEKGEHWTSRRKYSQQGFSNGVDLWGRQYCMKIKISRFLRQNSGGKDIGGDKPIFWIVGRVVPHPGKPRLAKEINQGLNSTLAENACEFNIDCWSVSRIIYQNLDLCPLQKCKV